MPGDGDRIHFSVGKLEKIIMKAQVLSIVAIALASILSTGCTINQLEHSGLQPQAEPRTGTVALPNAAEGFTGGKVGWGRVTLFAIPVVPIYIQGDESTQLMENIQEALALAGYDTVSTASDTYENQLVLTAKVNKTRYSNYTWLVPLVPTWGGMNVTLSLVNSNGDVTWSDDFEGSGFTMNFTDGYNIASRKSMTKMLDAMTTAFVSDEFYSALQQ